VNAVLQRTTELERVGVIRLCLPSCQALPPFSDIPEDLLNVIYGHEARLINTVQKTLQHTCLFIYLELEHF
jgi:hypothetical protein